MPRENRKWKRRKRLPTLPLSGNKQSGKSLKIDSPAFFISQNTLINTAQTSQYFHS
jgi:hypothetical protein